MSSPPDWQDGECCFRCRTQFSLVSRKHHCRNCGNIFCAKCSSQQIPLPKLNLEKNVRVCDTCYEKITKGKDSLTLALGSTEAEPKQDQAPAKQKSSSSSKSSSKRSGANASAPSEQDLKEEEELQLALALSLSETPVKVSFPDYRHLEEIHNPTPGNAPTSSNSIEKSNNLNELTTPRSNNFINESQSISRTNDSTITNNNPVQPNLGLDPASIYNVAATTVVSPTNSTVSKQQLSPEAQIQERDQEVFRYVGDVMGTLEVFNNRLEACKLRNRPVANDAAIQSLFLKLNSEIQPKLSEYIKTYEDERGVSERLQDKLSEIADARAALEDLRQEHQEKMRQLAAEAEKQRQSQLALKLEAMRQKKTQMMQYQRELALQRIREQEMMYQLPQQQQQQQQQQQASGHDAQAPPATQTGQLQAYAHQLQQQQQQPTYEHAIQQQVAQTQAQTQQPVMQQSVSSTAVQQQSTWSSANINRTEQYQQAYALPQASGAQSQAGYVTQPIPQNHQLQHQQQTAVSHNQHQYSSYVAQQSAAPVTSVAQTAQAQAQAQPAAPSIDRAAIAQLEKQFLPEVKPDEEAPLISFDD